MSIALLQKILQKFTLDPIYLIAILLLCSIYLASSIPSVGKYLENLGKLYASKAFWPILLCIFIAGLFVFYPPYLRAYTVGDDELTYLNWAKNLWYQGGLFLEPTTLLSKPFFIYLRAALLALFSWDHQKADVFISSLHMSVLVTFASGITLKEVASRTHRFHWRGLVTTGVKTICLVYVAFFVGSYTAIYSLGLSEGFSIPFFLSAHFLFFFDDKSTHTAWIATSLFALALAMRLNLLLLFPTFFCMQLFATSKKGEKWSKLVLAQVPILIIVAGAIIQYALSAVDIYQIGQYFAKNTSTDFLLKDTFDLFSKMFITPLDVAIWAIVVFQLGYGMFQDVGRRKELWTLAICVVTFNFLVQVPFASVGYYPRGIMHANLQLAIFTLWFIDRTNSLLKTANGV